MRIAIIGAGGIGGYLAAKLLDSGQDVAILARGAHLAAIRADGLRLTEQQGNIRVQPPIISDRPNDLGTADFVIFAVKAYHMAEAIEAARPIMADTGLALSFLNGVDAPDMLSAAFGRARALLGIARIFANMSSPGVITRHGKPNHFTIGDFGGSQTNTAVERIRNSFIRAGVSAPDCADVRVDLWAKFILFNGLSGCTAAARCSMGDVWANDALSATFLALTNEAAQVARARGIKIGPADMVRIQHLARDLPDKARASTANDLDHGKPLEIPWLAGAVARMGRELNVPVPVSTTVAALLEPWQHGTKKERFDT